MLKKIPFGDTLLKELDIINPESVCLYDFSVLVSLSKRFPQLGLTDASSQDILREEFMDFKLSPADHPPIVKYMSADKTCRPQAVKFWLEVMGRKGFHA